MITNATWQELKKLFHLLRKYIIVGAVIGRVSIIKKYRADCPDFSFRVHLHIKKTRPLGWEAGMLITAPLLFPAWRSEIYFRNLKLLASSVKIVMSDSYF